MMKKLAWSLALGTAGGTLFGLSPAVALTPEQIAQKLGQVPVFLIVDERGEPLPVLITEDGKPNSPEQAAAAKPIVPVYLSQATAKEELETARQQAGSTDRQFQLISFSFGFLYKERMKDLRGEAQFLLVPENSAYRPTTALLGTEPQLGENQLFFTIKPENANAPLGAPLYFAVVADEEGRGSAVLVGENRDRIPLFFSREEMMQNLEQLKENNPDVVSRLGVGVMRLDQAIEIMAAGKDDELSEAFLFVPSPEARQFVTEFRKQVEEQQGGASQLAQ